MVHVVPGVPDRDILEQTSVRPQNVVSPGPHHLSLPPQEARQNAWISAETWRLINERVSTRQDPRYGQAERRRMGKAITESLVQYRQKMVEEAGGVSGCIV